MVNGYYGVTGWSGGGRVPVSYNLRAGQFRGMRGMNVFNNFSTCYMMPPPPKHCDCGGGSGMPNWMGWLMGGGMVLQSLGGLLGGLFGGGRADYYDGYGGGGGGGSTMSNADAQTFENTKTVHGSKWTLICNPLDNGKYEYKAYLKSEPSQVVTASTAQELQNLLDNWQKPDATEEPEPTAQTRLQAQLEAVQTILQDQQYKDITAEIKDGKIVYKYGTGEFNTLTEATAAKAAAASNGSADHQNVRLNAASPVTYQPTANDKTWYDLFCSKYEIPAGTSPQKIKLAACKLAKLSAGDGIQLNSNGTISTTTNKGPGSFTSLSLPPSITLDDGSTYTLKS